MLLLYPEKVPHAPPDNLDHPNHHQQNSRLHNIRNIRRKSQSPSQSEHQIKHNRIIVELCILVAQMIPQKLMSRARVQKPPIIFLYQTNNYQIPIICIQCTTYTTTYEQTQQKTITHINRANETEC
jgi:hypothetical protein